MTSRRFRRAFTLIEILIVVIILGILASIVVPQFATASADAKKVAESNTVQTLRNQIAFYRLQHNDSDPTVDQLWVNMLKRTQVDGTTGSGSTFVFGPYLSAPPVNPYNGKSNVIAAGPLGGDGCPTSAILDVNTAGFVYDVDSGRVWATTRK